jgi:peptide-methionine (R)-S-oxide reductase
MTWTDVLNLAGRGNPPPPNRVNKSEDEWRTALTAEEFEVLRRKGTERAWTGEYCQAHDPGLYACRACGTALFDSRAKFESGSGWPSFTVPAEPNVIKYTQDFSYGMRRIEVSCNVCNSHLGHVFPDGPPPTGLRFCINSLAICLVQHD